jgi:predicted AlkP superfamily pyrophosphatase or phosphodiesterase
MFTAFKSVAVWLCLAAACFASAYDAHPKLIVIIVIDQFRGDYPERYRDQFGDGGFRLFLDHGADFTDCNYDYANTRTAPGHATLLTGAYSNDHGIIANEWWVPEKKRMVTSVQDEDQKLVGVDSKAPGASPRNLLADTLGDELKMATQGKSRVFSISLKDRAAVIPGGYSADAAYWIEPKSGAWITSTYYRDALPKWAQDFNQGDRASRYLNRDWTDKSGKVLRSTRPLEGKESGFYELVGSTPFANDYEFDFAKELILYERAGDGPATDLLAISLSANDILGHQVGPDSPEQQAMALALDHQLAEFFNFLGHQLGLANVWIALSADHGIAPLPSVAAALRIPAANLSAPKLKSRLNEAITARVSPGHPAEYIAALDYPLAWLNDQAFAAAKVPEADAERMVGEALKQFGARTYYTRSQLAEGMVPNSPMGRRYLNSYAPLPAWYVMAEPVPFTVGSEKGTDHGTPFTYDTHVPLLIYGLPFQPGIYRARTEPVDLAVTFASLLGINAPTHAVGRVLTEALAAHTPSGAPRPRSADSSVHPKPAAAPIGGLP